jgi:hypothetical protein
MDDGGWRMENPGREKFVRAAKLLQDGGADKPGAGKE